MIPINEVPVGKFVRFAGSVVYVYKNNFNDVYGIFPIQGKIATNKQFNHKVYVYKRIKKDWVTKAKGWLESLFERGNGQTIKDGFMVEEAAHIDNLLYVENLDILKSYGI
jgi:hypothetical protein